MTYQQWVDLFEHTTDDKKLRDALTKAGITEIPQIERDELDVTEDIAGEGISLVFTDASILNKEALAEGPAVLSSVIMFLQLPKMKNVYKGPLPSNLQLKDSRASLKKRLGKPNEENEMFDWDRWKIDNLVLTVAYSEDLNSINRVIIGLPHDK